MVRIFTIDLEVSIPGNITCKQLEAILLDMAALALKLYKSLAARLFPIAAKKAGEMTEFTSPYHVDCQVFKITESMSLPLVKV